MSRTNKRPTSEKSILPSSWRVPRGMTAPMLSRRQALFFGASAIGVAMADAGTAHEQDVTSPETELSPMEPKIVQMDVEVPPGEIHVVPDRFELYWTIPDAQAWLYKIRVGREDLYEPGRFYIGAKKEWPSWTPTPDMIAREPEKYEQFKDGMDGGPDNPLGARALYLFQAGRGDTFLRIHGTNEPATIGRAVSNGCVGLTNDHIRHLYDRVPMESTVFLYPKATADTYTQG
ncbi:L,D-transpeptidase [Roseivivax sp. THAF30]|uniref:L,D-transpeptidase n=1 Tax=Roseivivax sp. THAF30 TaxID=2587852 RepID=UPI0012AA39D4|nr:putative L,D-transpeptidase ErfK/SrfK precursor [Roseivivax sp. THAF30]